MLKSFSKLVLFGFMATTLILSAGVVAEDAEAGLCNQDDNCTDNGCAAGHGACGAFTKTGPCICFFAPKGAE